MKTPNIFQRIKNFLGGSFQWVGRLNLYGDFIISKEDFSRCIFINIIDLLTDLINDTTLTLKRGDSLLFSEFKYFFEMNGKIILNRLFIDGFVVVGKNAIGFKVLEADEYNLTYIGNEYKITATKGNYELHLLKSQTYIQEKISDRQLLLPFIIFLNNILNGMNTVSERLGSLLIATPEQMQNLPQVTILNEEHRKDIEYNISKNYGALSHQKQLLILNRPMKFQRVSLSETDKYSIDKARFAILVIADRIKVPANQIAVIDAASSRSLANGSELREGDFLKYSSYERLLNQVFVNFALTLGLSIDYSIYNKPSRNENILQ